MLTTIIYFYNSIIISYFSFVSFDFFFFYFFLKCFCFCIPQWESFFLGSIKASLPLIVLVAFLRWTMRENTRWGERFTPNGRTKGAEGGGWGRGEQELKRLSVCLSVWPRIWNRGYHRPHTARPWLASISQCAGPEPLPHRWPAAARSAPASVHPRCHSHRDPRAPAPFHCAAPCHHWSMRSA